MLGFPCVPGLRSEPDQQSRKCANDGVGEAAADFMQLSCGEYRSVFGEDKEKSRTQIVGPVVVLIGMQSRCATASSCKVAVEPFADGPRML